MSTKTDPAFLRSFDRQMLRSAFQSLFWSVFSDRKRKGKMTQQQFADALGVDKSAVSRSFSIPQNWTIDKLADMAGVLGVELVVEARDAAASGVVFTAIGVREPVRTITSSSNANIIRGKNSIQTSAGVGNSHGVEMARAA
jgi:transcriptional regulator with XRE-family HTH domain